MRVTLGSKRFTRAFPVAAVLAAALAAGCASTATSSSRVDAGAPKRPRHAPEDASVTPSPDLTVPGMEETSLLLLLVDRQLYEPFSLNRLLQNGRPELRRELASTLARVPDPRAQPLLEELAIDGDAAVRRAAAFAAGRVGGKEAATLLERLLLDPDDEVAAWACHGLAGLGVPLDAIAARLAALPREARQARLLPDLPRFASAADRTLYEGIAVEGLSAPHPLERHRALRALVAVARATQRPAFLRLLDDPDAEVRALAAAGLGKVGAADDLDPLRAALDDADPRVPIAAIDAGAAIVRAGRAAPPAAWREPLVARMTDARPAVRAAALSASSAWLLDPALETALGAAARSGSVSARARALTALASARAAAAGDLTVAAAVDPEPWVRAAAARAAGSLGSIAMLDQLASDASALVRESVLAARVGRDDRANAALFARFLGDPATGVRGAVLERLARSPLAPYEAILTAFAKDERGSPELALAGVAALGARAEAAATERGSIVATLEGLTEVATFPVRVAAADALEVLGRPRPAVGAATTTRPPADYRSMTAQTRRPRWVRLETARGVAVLRVDCTGAPLQSIAFLQLVGQGFYDGSSVYRVWPGARLEAGDPDGDGRGGPGFTLRDEPEPRRLVRGSFGLVRPAAHAAGSRFFVQLDDDGAGEGEVAVLGDVVSGLDVVESLLEGDRIVRLREVAEPPELHSEPTGRRSSSRSTATPPSNSASEPAADPGP